MGSNWTLRINTSIKNKIALPAKTRIASQAMWCVKTQWDTGGCFVYHRKLKTILGKTFQRPASSSVDQWWRWASNRLAKYRLFCDQLINKASSTVSPCLNHNHEGDIKKVVWNSQCDVSIWLEKCWGNSRRNGGDQCACVLALMWWLVVACKAALNLSTDSCILVINRYFSFFSGARVWASSG